PRCGIVKGSCAALQVRGPRQAEKAVAEVLTLEEDEQEEQNDQRGRRQRRQERPYDIGYGLQASRFGLMNFDWKGFEAATRLAGGRRLSVRDSSSCRSRNVPDAR